MLNKLKRALVLLETVVASSSLLLLLLLLLIQIIARNVFETGFPQLDVISRHLVLFVIFFGAGLVTEQGQHIRIDILASLLSPQQRKILVRPLLGLCALLCAAMAWYAGLFWLSEWQYAQSNERLAAVLAAVIPVGFTVLALHFSLLALLGSEPSSELGSEPAKMQDKAKSA
ncbi:hypothetical protein MNBD_GAMMA24-1848 [hydrothermal vent metagenome]|uniref:Tripartite ATP-independent periplasmic transporters DctQ component domain-containing protein n=1 Tax=hydrothermal vent metagenome TaxID=652676 RepID=A0A3B1BM05_9ZZZZ